MLGIIIVDFRGSERTSQFIQEELVKIQLPYKVAVVVNAAVPEAVNTLAHKLNGVVVSADAEVRDSDESVFIIPQSENLGFAKGNNLGAEFLMRNFGCEYILFSNNDIILKNANVVEVLIDRLKRDSSIGMIGPEVVGLDSKRQSPEPYIPMADRFVKMYLYTFGHSKEEKIRRFQLDYAEKAAEGYHFRIMGSFFIMPSSVFQEIGGMDPNTFLYAEEPILAKRLEQVGKKVYYCPQVTVIHDHGATTSKHLNLMRRLKIQAKSEKYYYTAYCGVPSWKASLYVSFFLWWNRAKSFLQH